MSPLEDSWKQPDQEASRGTAAYSASHNGFILFSSQRHQSLLESDSTGEEVCELTTHRATIALLGGNKKQISLKRLILERLFVILFHADKFPSVLNKIKRTQLEEHK